MGEAFHVQAGAEQCEKKGLFTRISVSACVDYMALTPISRAKWPNSRPNVLVSVKGQIFTRKKSSHTIHTPKKADAECSLTDGAEEATH